MFLFVQLAVPLKDDVDFDAIGCISLYCEEFTADLGHLEVKAFSKGDDTPGQAQESPDLSRAPAGGDAPDSGDVEPEQSVGSLLYGLSNCKTLLPDYLNLYWSVADGKVKMALEGRPGTGNLWMAFGFSNPDATVSRMVGSDVVVTGFIEDSCFAFNYYLSSRDQCDFTSGNGVCAQKYINGAVGAENSIERDIAISCNRDGGYMSVLFERELESSGGTWPVDGSSPAIYAMGPVSEKSDSTKPVVLYHILRLPGQEEQISVTSPGSSKLTIALDTETQACSSLNASLSDTIEEVPIETSVATIRGVDTFVFETGSNKNYPNPPGWGLSYYVNGEESPILEVKRGATYTFVVQAGPTHPLYLTSSIVGAGLLNGFEGEIVYAGGEEASGTLDKPFTFTWAPDDSVPEVLYYQCALHQKIGWEIRVVDDDNTPSLTPFDSLKPPPPPAVQNECSFEMNGKSWSFSQCSTFGEGARAFEVAWTLIDEQDEENPNFSRLRIGLQGKNDYNYISIGLPARSSQMVGSSAMILASCSTCSSGASLKQYLLGGKDAFLITESNDGLVVVSSEASLSAERSLKTGIFEVLIPRDTENSSRRRLSQAGRSLDNFNIIFASGPFSGDGSPQQHYPDSYGSSDINLVTGGVTTQYENFNYDARTAHMWLMSIGWGVLIPVGILMAKARDIEFRYWFITHRLIQVFGYLMGIAGIGAGFAFRGTWETPYSAHRDIGITITALGTIQILSLVARPSPTHKLRKYWGYWHRWIGRCTALLAIANIYYGIYYVAHLRSWAGAVYSVVLGIIVLLALAEDVYILQNRKSSERMTKKIESSPSSTDDIESNELQGKGSDSTSKGSPTL